MVDLPIPFSAPMVLALLAGRKQQTRRLSVKDDMKTGAWRETGWQKVKPGTRLWVREAHEFVPASAYRGSDGVQYTVNPSDTDEAAIYRAGWDRSGSRRWRPSIRMPRWASRLTLTVTDARVERLQEISEADAVAEGWPMDENDPVTWFAELWNSLHGPGAWDANPEVVRICFDCARRTIDAISERAS